jgi:hypothetical protein
MDNFPDLRPVPHPGGHTCPQCGSPSLWYPGDHIRTRGAEWDRRRDWCEPCIRLDNAAQLARKLAASLPDSDGDQEALFRSFEETPALLLPILHPEFDRLFLAEKDRCLPPPGDVSDSEWLEFVEILRSAARMKDKTPNA